MSLSLETTLSLLPPDEATEYSPMTLSAETENIANGGIGMLCNQPIAPGTVVRCELAVFSSGVHVPTLLRARWLDLAEGDKRYRVGLQFLI